MRRDWEGRRRRVVVEDGHECTFWEATPMGALIYRCGAEAA